MKKQRGIGMFGDITIDPKTGQMQSMQQRLLQIIEQVKFADEQGVDIFAAGEHHREDFAIASPEMILAALAPLTKNIILSSGVSVLGSSDPVKLYSDFSTIDLISEGRAEIMAGRGSFIESFPLYGYELKDYEGLFEEKLELLLKIISTQNISWSGKHRASLKNQQIFPRAKNGLPVWIAVGGTPESAIRAARLGLPIIFAIIGGRWEDFEGFIDLYKHEYIKAGHDEEKMQIGVHMHCFVAESKQRIVENYFPLYATQMDRVGKSRGRSAYKLEQFVSGMDSYGALCMGNSQDVANKIAAVVEKFGLTRFIAHMDIGGPKHEDMIKSIDLYSNEVIPALNKYFNN